MTVVPAAAVLAHWTAALWRGDAGGDDLLDVVRVLRLDPEVRMHGRRVPLLAAVAELRDESVDWAGAFCTDAGVDLLPGPRLVTERAVAAGQALALYRTGGRPSLVAPIEDGAITVLEALPARPHPLHVRACAVELAEAVLAAEAALRCAPPAAVTGAQPTDPPPCAPHTPAANRGLIVRASRMWTVAGAAIDAGLPHPELRELRRIAARACLTAYAGDPVPAAPPARQTVRDRPW